MDFDISDEQRQLADGLRKMLADHAPADRLRQLIDAGRTVDPELWQAIVEMGLPGATVAEELGGVELGELDLCIVAEELGRMVAPVPFFASACLATEALRLASSAEQQARWLPWLAGGEVTAALAWGADAFAPALDTPTFSGGRLNGVSAPVADAACAGLLVVGARGEDGPVFVLAETGADAAGVEVAPLAGFDELRGYARVTFRDAPAQRLVGADGAAFARQLRYRAATYQAFEQIGGAEACLYMARDYARERIIFGRSLASYQAIKHKLADILVDLELARSNAYYAAWALQNGDPGLAAAAATARLAASRVYERAARENLQIHGGIGYTWEADCHFHYRRARLLAVDLGGEEAWADALIAAIEAEAA